MAGPVTEWNELLLKDWTSGMLEQAYTSFRDMVLYISSQLHIQWRKVCSMKLTKWVYFHHKNYPLFLPAPQESVYQHTSGIMWSSAQIHNLTIPVGSQSENWSREETCRRRKRLWGKPSTPLEISNNSRVGAFVLMATSPGSPTEFSVCSLHPAASAC